MGKQSRHVTKEDILSLDLYSNQRKKLRKELLEFKKKRRIAPTSSILNVRFIFWIRLGRRFMLRNGTPWNSVDQMTAVSVIGATGAERAYGFIVATMRTNVAAVQTGRCLCCARRSR